MILERWEGLGLVPGTVSPVLKVGTWAEKPASVEPGLAKLRVYCHPASSPSSNGPTQPLPVYQVSPLARVSHVERYQAALVSVQILLYIVTHMII